MKKLLSIIFAIVLTISCPLTLVEAAEAPEDVDSESLTRDFIQADLTQKIYSGSKYVTVRIHYYMREDLSNSSGYRIVSVGNGSVTPDYSGWTSVSSILIIDQDNIDYTFNRQVASIPVTYYVSMGYGYVAQQGTATINLL